jgi:2-polyprenyl-6-methoxyphenol hydroxylase-like FAD-dependent oxidoreductase
MRRRHAEIAGAGLAGLTAACALAQRGWSVRVHERADRLRTTGAGISIYENGLRVLEAVGAYEAAVASADPAHLREIRDENDRAISVQTWDATIGARLFNIVRQNVIDALAAAATRAGAEIVTSSHAVAASPEGELLLANGRRYPADIVIGADGNNSNLRDSLGLLASRRQQCDGAIRLLIDKTPAERASPGRKTVEHWSGSRRLIYTPCSERDVYIAMTMLDSDAAARKLPIDKAEWRRSFPHLAALIERIGAGGRYDRFELIRLKHWSAGRVALIGDAAHALPPNLGQGGGLALMNALSLAVCLDRAPDIVDALALWERNERPLTEHVQRISVLYGLPTTWPTAARKLFFRAAGKWLAAERMRIAARPPLGAGDRPCVVDFAERDRRHG